MQARFYLPMWGRFASPVPGRDQHFEETQSWNIYSYCQNNPIMNTDPTGMSSVKESWNDLKNKVSSWYNNLNNDFKANAKRSGEATLAAYNKPYQVKSAAVIESLQKGEVKGAAKNLGQAWGAAIKDPEWVAGAALATATAFVGPEAAGATPKGLVSLGEVFENPGVLKGATPAQVKALAQNEGWSVGMLGKGSQKGNGLMVRELGSSGEPTGRLIQWHPGGGHHGAQPYWKVSSGTTGTVRVGPQF